MNRKKIFSRSLALAFVVCTAMALSSCAALDAILSKLPTSSGTGVCNHSIVEIAAKSPTCEEAGNSKHFSCSKCGKLYADANGKREISIMDTVVSPLSHVSGEWITDVEPTCSVQGSRHKECTNCGVTVQTSAIFAKGHTFTDAPASEANCYENGYSEHKICSVCGRTKDKQIIPGGHVGEWIATDASYEQLLCSVCGRIQKREKSVTVDFEGGAILDAAGKLSVAVGKLTGEGDPAISAAPGLIEFGNARDRFSLVPDGANKVLMVIGKNNPNYATSSITVSHTDSLHKANAKEDGGKYLVFDFDVNFDFRTGSATTADIFTIWIGDTANNYISTMSIQSYNQQIKANFGPVLEDCIADGNTWITFRTVVELATEKGADGKYTATVKLYYKLRDAEGPMIYLTQSTRSSKETYAYVGRTDNFVAKLVAKNQTFDYTYCIDNLSFIRTNDANYTFSACDHVMSAWTVESEAVKCTTDGVAKRSCTVAGCGYTEREYISAHDLSAFAGKEATCTEAGYTSYLICSECQTVIGKKEIPVLSHVVSDWIVADDVQERSCENGCGYYERRDNIDYTSVTFDDGTVTGGKLVYSSNVTIGSATAASTDGYANFATVTAPGRAGDTALCINTVISNYVSGKAPTVGVPLMGSAGNVYTLDFDLYDATKATHNGTSCLLQIKFGGAAISINTYSESVQFGSGSKGLYQIGTLGSWIGVRMVFTVTQNGKASCDIFVKNTDGSYKYIYTKAVSSSGIQLDSACRVVFDCYSAELDRTYYLDNLSFTRHEVGYSTSGN